VKTVTTKRPDGSIRVQTFFEKKSKTQAHMAEACDLNKIMSRYLKSGGSFRNLPNPQGVYADLSEMGDYQSSLNQIAKAQQAFEALPSYFRAELANDPGNLIPWLQNPNHQERAIQMGLLKPKVDEKTINSQNTTKKVDDDKKPDPKP